MLDRSTPPTPIHLVSDRASRRARAGDPISELPPSPADDFSAAWLQPHEAAKYLRVGIADLITLLKSEQITAHGSIGSGLFFNRYELDAAFLPIPAEEAAAILARSFESQEKTSDMTTSTSSTGQPDDFMPLQHAAKALGNIKYKTLLVLVNRGEVPAKNIGAKGKRPRWVVSLSLVKAALISQAERETAMRRSPQPIDVARFMRTGGRHA